MKTRHILSLVLAPQLLLGVCAIYMTNRNAESRKMDAMVESSLSSPFRPIIVLRDDSLLLYPITSPEIHAPHMLR